MPLRKGSHVALGQTRQQKFIICLSLSLRVCHLVCDDACKQAPATYWVWDAVHPTYSGHQLMANAWIKAVGEFYK